MIRPMVSEAELKDGGAGLVVASQGWFVMNARDDRWFHRPGRGKSLPPTGVDECEAETFFPMLGMSIQVVPPGEPTTTYHRETGPWGSYCADPVAARYNASPPEDTQDGRVAYARFEPSQPARYREGLLP